MSPKQPAAPLFAGSVRQAACFCPSLSSRVRSQPWMYSARIAWISPSSPDEDHLPGLPHERVAGVVVRDGEDRLRLLATTRGELLGFGERERERLVADDIEARLDGRLGDREVHVVGRGDETKSIRLSAGSARSRSSISW